jgi:hypothetical protein
VFSNRISGFSHFLSFRKKKPTELWVLIPRFFAIEIGNAESNEISNQITVEQKNSQNFGLKQMTVVYSKFNSGLFLNENSMDFLQNLLFTVKVFYKTSVKLHSKYTKSFSQNFDSPGSTDNISLESISVCVCLQSTVKHRQQPPLQVLGSNNFTEFDIFARSFVKNSI